MNQEQGQETKGIIVTVYKRRYYTRKVNNCEVAKIEHRLTCKKRKVIDWFLYSLLVIMSVAASGASMAIFALI